MAHNSSKSCFALKNCVLCIIHFIGEKAEHCNLTISTVGEVVLIKLWLVTATLHNSTELTVSIK